jgi:hypothetical protein
MEMCDDTLAPLPRKYVADFIVLLDDPSFQQEPDSRSQMVIATQIIRQKKNCVPFSMIASFFHVAKGTIQQHWKRAQHGLFANGRRSVLSNEVIGQMFQFITSEFGHGRPVFLRESSIGYILNITFRCFQIHCAM